MLPQFSFSSPLVFDGAFADILIDEPIKVTIENGQATKIEGGIGAKQLQITLNTIGANSRKIAELGIGTNKAARLESSILEIEKVYGTAHVALGNNMHIGGEVDVSYHADGVILKPTLELDGKVILKDMRNGEQKEVALEAIFYTLERMKGSCMETK